MDRRRDRSLTVGLVFAALFLALGVSALAREVAPVLALFFVLAGVGVGAKSVLVWRRVG